jgi:maleylpyruvate isomerase
MPSLLPGWTVGHVLAHVARNAESHRRRAEAAVRGELVEQYVGGYAGRAAEIEQGSGQSAVELIEDVLTTGQALIAEWAALPVEVWSNRVLDVSGREHDLAWLPGRRWQELEIHLVDLGIGRSSADWPEEFVADRLPALRMTLSSRLPSGARPPEPGSIPEHEELAWMFGRLKGEGLAELSPWE